MYWLMWGILTFGVMLEVYGTDIVYRDQHIIKQKTTIGYFIFATVSMTLMAVLRYGQGTDYLAYA